MCDSDQATARRYLHNPDAISQSTQHSSGDTLVLPLAMTQLTVPTTTKENIEMSGERLWDRDLRGVTRDPASSDAHPCTGFNCDATSTEDLHSPAPSNAPRRYPGSTGSAKGAISTHPAQRVFGRHRRKPSLHEAGQSNG